MIEFTISLNGVNDKTIDRECSRLHNRVRDLGGIFSTLVLNNDVFFLIAGKENEDLLYEEITRTVCNIIKSFKTEYVVEKLKFKTKNNMKACALVKALVNFDMQSDNKVIRYKLKLKNELNVYSFYKFCLGDLRDKWLQLIEITNQNIGFLGFDETYIDIVRFLVDGISEGEELKATMHNRKVSIYNKNNELLQEYSFDIERFMDELISHNPSKLTIQGFSGDINDFLMQLFADRIKIN